MNYLLHTSLLLAGCFAYYWVVLRSETHFKLNRWVLLGCLVGSLALPLITVPAEISLRQAIAEEQIEGSTALPHQKPEPGQQADPKPAEASPGLTLTNKAEETAVPELPAGREAKSGPEAHLMKTTPFDWWSALFWVYVAGLVVFGANFLLQLGQLLIRMVRNPGHDLGEFHLVELDEDEAPFSFWNRIFLNPDRYDEDTFHQIVQHEQIHVNQKHSLDLLLAEAVVVLQWFNPFAWLYRKAIEHNLEYLTDAEMLRGGNDPEIYQMSLVKVAIPNYPNGLVASYNQSFLEKRITMMKTRKSSFRSGWKYFALLPLLLLSVLQFNAVAQGVPPVTPEGPVAAAPTVPAVPVPAGVPSPVAVATPVPTPAPVPDQAYGPVPAPNALPNPAPVPNPAPAAAAPLSLPNVPGMDMRMNMAPANDRDLNSWTALIEGSEICFQFMSRSDAYNNRYNYQSSRCFGLSQFGNLPRNEMGTFALQRTAGTMTFKGVFEGDDGVGNFSFAPDPYFARRLREAGFGRYEEREMMLLFMADMNDEYIAYLKSQGYDPSHDKLLELAIFYNDLDELKTRLTELGRMGFEKPSLQKLIELQIHGVSEDYARELKDSGFEDLSLQDLIEARIHGVSAQFLTAMAESGFSGLSFDRAKEMAIHGIGEEYIREMASLGYKNLGAQEIVNAKIHGVNADKIEDFRRAGLTNLTLEEAKNMSIHGVSSEFVATLAEFGFTSLSPQDITDAKIHGLTASKLRAFKATGLPIDDLRDVQNASIHGVDAAYVAGMRAIGYKDLDLDDFAQGRIHGVSPEWVSSFREVGFKDIPFKTLINLRIHGVDARFIKERQQDGRTLQDYVKMKIHGF